MSVGAAVLGCSGLALEPGERSFFKEANPWGFILFTRNAQTPEQVRALTGDLRDCVGRDAPVFIDQEGGRVARLLPPRWIEWPPPLEYASALGESAERGLWLRHRIISMELREAGIDANCVPCADLATAGTHEIIRNRCYGEDVDSVARRARAVADGCLAGGVLPVLKHIPGHGRPGSDSHVELPVVDLDLETLRGSDFEVFRRLSDLPLGMTAHVVYKRLDPEAPATLSRAALDMVRGEIGFEGLLMSDDISMSALSGGIGQRCRGALGAGCDVVLHCNGEMDEMAVVAEEAGLLKGESLARAERALSMRAKADDPGLGALIEQYNSVSGDYRIDR